MLLSGSKFISIPGEDDKARTIFQKRSQGDFENRLDLQNEYYAKFAVNHS